MKRSRTARILQRSPGEVAFDRCFFPLAALFFLVVGEAAADSLPALFTPVRPRAARELALATPASKWSLWVAFSVGLVAALLWLRALVSVAGAWHDPSTRVLRFSALGLLLFLAWAVVRLLLLPFA